MNGLTPDGFVSNLKGKFESQYPGEDFFEAINSVDEKGRATHHLDEIIPCSKFDARPIEQTALWHHFNAQYVPASEYMSKGANCKEGAKDALIKKA